MKKLPTYSHILDDLKRSSLLTNQKSDDSIEDAEKDEMKTMQKFWNLPLTKPRNSHSIPKKHLKNLSEKQNSNFTSYNGNKSTLIRITKDNLKNLLKEIQNEVDKEAPKKKVEYKDALDELIETSSKNVKHKKNDKKLVLSKNEMKEIFKNYEKTLKESIKSKEERYLEQWTSYYNSMKDYCEKYYQLQNLLWYYYSSQPDIYQRIMDEYYLKNNDNALKKLGLNEKFSNLAKNNYKFEMIEKYIPPELQGIDMSAPRFKNPMIEDHQFSEFVKKNGLFPANFE